MTTTNDDSANELIATLIEANATALNKTTNHLIDYYRHAAAENWATYTLIRENVETLFSGPYQPSEKAIMFALYPKQNDIHEMTEEQLNKTS